jgi:hypothetical protein
MKVADMKVGAIVAYAPNEYSINYQDYLPGRLETVAPKGSGHYATHTIQPLDPKTLLPVGATGTVKVRSKQVVKPWEQYKDKYEEKKRAEEERQREAATRKVLTDQIHEVADRSASLLKMAGVDCEVKSGGYQQPAYVIVISDFANLEALLKKVFAHKLSENGLASQVQVTETQP